MRPRNITWRSQRHLSRSLSLSLSLPLLRSRSRSRSRSLERSGRSLRETWGRALPPRASIAAFKPFKASCARTQDLVQAPPHGLLSYRRHWSVSCVNVNQKCDEDFYGFLTFRLMAAMVNSTSSQLQPQRFASLRAEPGQGAAADGSLIVAARQVVLDARLTVVHNHSADGAHVLGGGAPPPRPPAPGRRLRLAARPLCLHKMPCALVACFIYIRKQWSKLVPCEPA